MVRKEMVRRERLAVTLCRIELCNDGSLNAWVPPDIDLPQAAALSALLQATARKIERRLDEAIEEGDDDDA